MEFTKDNIRAYLLQEWNSSKKHTEIISDKKYNVICIYLCDLFDYFNINLDYTFDFFPVSVSIDAGIVYDPDAGKLYTINQFVNVCIKFYNAMI